MYGYGAVSYTDPTQISNVAVSLDTLLIQNPQNQAAVVAQLQQMDGPTQAAVCAAMQVACGGMTGCASSAAAACVAAQAVTPQATPTAGGLSVTGAVVLGVAVVGLLFWALD
jgi:hypothetical protein